jgi:O-antigen/teichoic acid export membrane protein
LVSVGVLAWLGIGTLLSPLALFLIPLLVSHLHLAPSVGRVAKVVFYWGYAYVFFNASVSIVGSVLTGMGELWLTSLVNVVTRVLYALLLVGFLLSGFGLYSLIYASSVQTLATFIFFVIIIRRRVGRPFGNPFRLGRALLKELVQFGGWTQLQGLFVVATYETDPLVIGTLISPAAVGVYSVADRLAQQIRFVPSILLSSLLPAASELHAKQKYDELRKAAIYGNRYTSFLCFGASGLIIALSSVLFRVWLNRTYPNLDLITALLIASYLLVGLSVTGLALSTAMGRADLAAKLAPIGLVINLILTLALVKPLGIVGVLYGTVISMTIWVIIYLRAFHRFLGVSSRDAVWSWLWKLTLVTGVAATLTRLVLSALPSAWMSHRTSSVAVLSALTIVYAVLFLVGLYVSHFVTPGDLEMAERILPGRATPIARSRVAKWMAHSH